MASKFLKAFQPIVRFIPEIRAPQRRVSFTEKLLWTATALIIYLAMSEIPLYGLGKGEDILFYRVIFASSKGTLMELGIGPIVTAGLILQLLAASGFIDVDFSDPGSAVTLRVSNPADHPAAARVHFPQWDVSEIKLIASPEKSTMIQPDKDNQFELKIDPHQTITVTMKNLNRIE